MYSRRQVIRSGMGIGALTVLAAGCGRGEAAGLVRIGFSQATLNHPYRVAMVKRNQRYAARHYPNVRLMVTDGQDKAQTQVSDMESLIARQPDVIMLSPVAEQALARPAEQAIDAGIKVVTLDRKVAADVTAHVGCDNVAIGTKAAKFHVEKLGGRGNIVEIQGTAGASVTNDRSNGFTQELAKHRGMKIVATNNANFMRQDATKYMEDVLQRFPQGQIDAVYAHNDEMALGAARALAQAGRVKDVFVTGIDGENAGIDAVAQGVLAATFTYPVVAPQGVQAAYRLALGEDVPKLTYLRSFQVDPANVKRFIGKGF